jgi:hypothetical protein
MITQSHIQQDSNLIRYALYGNAAFSSVSGLVFLLAANPVSTFLGVNAPIEIALLGIGLMGYAALLFYNASRPMIDPSFALFAVIGDSLWVLASIVLLVTGWLPFTTEGKWAVAIVAMIVDAFATLQFVGWRRIK